MSRRKADCIGPCVRECPNRSAECKATCAAYKAHREKVLAHYEQHVREVDARKNADEVQYYRAGKR